jgi:hypothetical protein
VIEPVLTGGSPGFQGRAGGTESTGGGEDYKVLKSIAETKKLFTVEGVAEGKVNVVVSEYLLSLPGPKQREVLTDHLERLTMDLSGNKHIEATDEHSQKNKIDKTQLQLMIQVIEGLLEQI